MAMQHRRKGTPCGVRARVLPLITSAALLWQGATLAEESASQARDEEPAAVAAVWRAQEISFYFQSFNTLYPCSSLTDKVRRLLLQLGADRNIWVRSTGCDIGMAMTRTVRIRLVAPAEATPELLAELEKSRTTRELVARVRGERPEAVDVAAQFPARWRKVSLSRTATNLDSGDCELIDEIKRQVLPKLAVRVVRDDLRCSPYQYSGGPVRLELEALMVMPLGLPTVSSLQEGA